MKKLTKLLSAALVVMMVASSVASAVTITADRAKTFGNDPTIMSNFFGGNVSSNGELTETTNETAVANVQLGYATNGLITFTFDEDMDVDTLIPENIKIFTYAPATINTAGASPTKYGLKAERFNADDSSVIYQPLEKSAREYVLWMGDFAARPYRIIFSANVKTAAGVAITEQTFVFRIGKNAKMPYREDKRIVQVGFNKPTYDQDGALVLATDSKNITGMNGDYSQNWAGSVKIAANGWWKVDLGNIYEVGDLATYNGMNAGYLNTNDIEIYYSSDPNAGFGADQVAPTLWGSLGTANINSSITPEGSNNISGVNGDRWLNPTNTVYARYIFLKNLNGSVAPVQGLDIFGYVNDYYTTITAEKGGEAVTECTGAGTYTFKAPVLDVAGENDASAYMIVAGYDADGVVTTIKCSEVNYDNGYLAMDAEMATGTASVKAALIESFANPYLLTDALILPAQ